jgi:hypothetical protein
MADDHADEAFTEIDPAKKKAEQASRRAGRSLRRARTIYEEGAWQPSVEADFLVKEALIAAMSELTDAIRGQSDQRAS